MKQGRPQKDLGVRCFRLSDLSRREVREERTWSSDTTEALIFFL